MEFLFLLTTVYYFIGTIPVYWYTWYSTVKYVTADIEARQKKGTLAQKKVLEIFIRKQKEIKNVKNNTKMRPFNGKSTKSSNI